MVLNSLLFVIIVSGYPDLFNFSHCCVDWLFLQSEYLCALCIHTYVHNYILNIYPFILMCVCSLYNLYILQKCLQNDQNIFWGFFSQSFMCVKSKLILFPCVCVGGWVWVCMCALFSKSNERPLPNVITSWATQLLGRVHYRLKAPYPRDRNKVPYQDTRMH